ncbi:MAG: CoA transferase [Chloroflexi bacterium]|nr:CoA transferase [Chloroflexota bacterium]MDA1147857.1 CoA transferase [Chloroflexota bacterium]
MRVIELSDREEAAAFAGKLFARWGAEVVKVEHAGREAPDASLDRYLNGGKRRVALDVQADDDRDALDRLVASSDVLIIDHAASVVRDRSLMDLGGADWQGTRLSITPFGLVGPYRDYAATAATLLAFGGNTWLSGDPGRAPLTIPGNYPYYQAGTYAYTAGLAGYLRNLDGGDALNLEIAIHEVLCTLHQFTDTMWTQQRIVRSRHGNQWENLCPTALYRCSDGWFGVNILQAFWEPFALMLGRPDLVDDPDFATNPARMERTNEVLTIVEEAFRDATRAQLFRDGQETWRVPIGPLLSMSEVLADRHLEFRDFWRPVAGDPEGPRSPGSPFRFVGEAMPEEQPVAAPGSTDPRGVPAPPSRIAAPGLIAASAPPQAPLAGIRVADMTRIWSGPLSTRILADLGAEVIKVEAPGGRGPAVPPDATLIGLPDGQLGERPWNRASLSNKLNRNKQSLAVDLKSPEGRDAFLRLVAASDVVIENFSTRAMPSLDLGYERLREVNERIIYVAMPAFGRTGPYEHYIGLGPSIEPVTGWTALMGYGPDEPRVTGQALTDAISGTTAAAAVMTALRRRAETGEGSFIELSQEEAGVTLFGEQFIEAQRSGTEPARYGNAHPQYAPHGVYRCQGADDWITIAVTCDEQWAALCAFADQGWDTDPRFATAKTRREHRDALDAAIDAWTQGWEHVRLTWLLQARGVPASPVYQSSEWLHDAHLEARGYYFSTEELDAGFQRYDGSPVRFNGERCYEGWRRAPGLGEHNREVLGGVLGYSLAEIEALEGMKVVVDRPPA